MEEGVEGRCGARFKERLSLRMRTVYEFILYEVHKLTL
jgi:hypothetical protein